MASLDKRLAELITQTCSCPQDSLERQRGLNQLIWEIQQSGKLLRGVGEPDYEDALQQTWLYLCRNLCEATTGDVYDPERASVITWINDYLKWRLKDNRYKWHDMKSLRVQTIMFEDDDCIDPVDHLMAPPSAPPIIDEIFDWLEKEKKILKRIYVRDRPDINCYDLIPRRLPPETAWEDLAVEFGVAVTTISNFYHRECRPRLKEFIVSQGYFEE